MAIGADRIQILSQPRALPGHCILCGYPGGEGRKFVDFNFDLDFFGAVIFCDKCILAVLEKLDFVSNDRASALNETIIKQMEDIQQLEAENAKLRAAFDSLDFIPTSNFNSRKKLSNSDSKKGPSDNRPAEPSGESRSDDISSNEFGESGDDDAFDI